MDDLLAHAIDAHGGLDRWSHVRLLTVQVAIDGPFWGRKGWPGALAQETMILETRRQHISITPFLAPGHTAVLDVAPERVAVRESDGTVISHRDDPRASFPAGDSAPWDALQLQYFISYAMWNYLTEPFLLTYPGVQAHEIEPWNEDGQIWRRLAVTFPATIATHNRDQVFYYDADGMQRRMDYSPDVVGSSLVTHYTDQPKTFDGIVIPTRRRVYRRNPDGCADFSSAVITIDIATASAD